MRPILSRASLRAAHAASRLLAGNQQPAGPIARQVSAPSRPCTSSAVSQDSSVKPAAAAPAAASTPTPPAAATTPPKDEPLAPLDEHAHPLPATDAAPAAAAESTTPDVDVRGSAANDPAELLEQLRELLDRNAVRSALFHFSDALKKPGSPAIDPAVLKLMLPVLGRQGWAATSVDAMNFALERGFNLGSGLYNCALHAMARSGDHDVVSEVIERMWALPPDSRPNATSYNYLIGTFMYRGSVDQAFEVLNTMKEHLIYPTFATYHALITGCLRAHDPKRAYSTLSAVEGQRFDVGAMTITQVLVACAQADLVEEAVDLLGRANDALPRYKSEVHRIAETRFAYRMARLQRTTAEERALIRGDPRIELAALQEVMQCAFRNGSTELAMAGWNSLRTAYPDLEIDSHLWYCLIGAFASSGDFTRALDVVGVMRESGLKPNMKDLEAALIKPMSLNMTTVDEQYYRLVDLVKGGGTEEKTEASSSESVDPDDPAAKDISAEAEPAEKVEEASMKEGEESTSVEETIEEKSDDPVEEQLSLKEVLSKRAIEEVKTMGWKDMKPNTVGIDELNAIIWACSIGKDLDRAFQTYDEVEQTFNLERNVDTFNALLEGCIEVRHVRGGMRIMTEVENAGLPISADTVHLMTRLYTRANQVDDAIDLVGKTIANGGKLGTKTMSNLLRYLIRGESLEKAAHVYNMGIDAGYSQRALLGRVDRDGMRKLKVTLGIDTEQSMEDSLGAGDTESQAEGQETNLDEGEASGGEDREATDDETEKTR